jgi:hypothetical protein
VKCRWNCCTAAGIAAAGAAYTDPACVAGCCTPDTTRINYCNGQCNSTYAAAVQAAAVGLWECFAACPPLGADPFGTGLFCGVSLDFYCVTACYTAQSIALFAAANVQALCSFDCQAAFNKQYVDCNTSDACRRPCLATYNAALLACLEGDDSEACRAAALADRRRCDLQCCLNRMGNNTHDPALLECEITRDAGYASANAACDSLRPGNNFGDPCFDPSSDACAAATAAWHACLDPLIASCDWDFTSCKTAAGPSPGCAGCVV